MKTVYLVRHAKSSWEFANLRDIERPLNERGLRDAPFMAKLMAQKRVKPDALLSSPAVRALSTATFFKNEMGLKGSELKVVDDIYEASSRKIIQIIQELPDTYSSVMLFGHNPTFTYVANHFNDGHIDNMPTCSIVRIDSQAADWKDFDSENASVTEFYFPKKYF